MSEEEPGIASESPPPEGERQPRSSFGHGVGCGLILFMGLLSVAILGFQVFAWLKTGEWYELPLSKTLGMAGVAWGPLVEIEGWAGASRILSLLVETPTALCPVIAAALILILTPK